MKLSPIVSVFIKENKELINNSNFTELIDRAKAKQFHRMRPEVKIELLYVLSIVGIGKDPTQKLVLFQDTAKNLEDMLRSLFKHEKLELNVDVDLLTGWMYLESNFHNARGPVKFLKINQDGTYTKPNLWDFKQRLITAYKYYCRLNNLEC